MELNEHNLEQEAEEHEVGEPTQYQHPQPSSEVKEFISLETPSGLKLHVGSCSLRCDELIGVVVKLRDQFNNGQMKGGPSYAT